MARSSRRSVVFVELCRVDAGDTGSVALAALKIPKAHGAREVITSSQDARLETASSLDADITVNYRTSPDWAAEVIAQTEDKGATL